jgi:hypothetical protein
MKDEILQDLHQSLPEPSSFDQDLTILSQRLEELSKTSLKHKEVLVELKKDIYVLHENWLNSGPYSDRHSDFAAIAKEYSSMWTNIEPVLMDVFTTGFLDLWPHNTEYSLWSLLKASVTFANLHRRGTFSWWVCGKQLCYLKALSRGFLPVTNKIYPILKPDVPLVKRLHSARLDADSGEMSDAEDGSTLQSVDYDE